MSDTYGKRPLFGNEKMEKVESFFQRNHEVARALTSFLESAEVTAKINTAAENCEADINSLIEAQGVELAAEAREKGINANTLAQFKFNFATAYCYYYHQDHVEVLWAYGCADAEERILNAFNEKPQKLYELVNAVCAILHSFYYANAYNELEKLVDGEECEE